jgi:hypothetical protein
MSRSDFHRLAQLKAVPAPDFYLWHRMPEIMQAFDFIGFLPIGTTWHKIKRL